MTTLRTAAINLLLVFSVDSRWHAGGDAHHHSAAGDGDASAKAQDVLKL